MNGIEPWLVWLLLLPAGYAGVFVLVFLFNLLFVAPYKMHQRQEARIRELEAQLAACEERKAK